MFRRPLCAALLRLSTRGPSRLAKRRSGLPACHNFPAVKAGQPRMTQRGTCATKAGKRTFNAEIAEVFAEESRETLLRSSALSFASSAFKEHLRPPSSSSSTDGQILDRKVDDREIGSLRRSIFLSLIFLSQNFDKWRQAGRIPAHGLLSPSSSARVSL